MWSAAALAGQNDKMVASRLLHQKVSGEKRGSDFNRPLVYAPRGIVWMPHRKELTQKKPVPCWRDRESRGI